MRCGAPLVSSVFGSMRRTPCTFGRLARSGKRRLGSIRWQAGSSLAVELQLAAAADYLASMHALGLPHLLAGMDGWVEEGVGSKELGSWTARHATRQAQGMPTFWQTQFFTVTRLFLRLSSSSFSWHTTASVAAGIVAHRLPLCRRDRVARRRKLGGQRRRRRRQRQQHFRRWPSCAAAAANTV